MQMTRTGGTGMTMAVALMLTVAVPEARQTQSQQTQMQQGQPQQPQARQTQAQQATKDWLEQTRKYEARREERQRVGDIFAALGVKPGARVADLGAGEGFFTARLAKAVGPAGRVVAIDADPKSIAKLRERVSREGLTNVEVIESTAQDARLPSASIDAALIVNAYHEMTEYQAILGQIRRALTPDGSLVIVEPLESLKRQAPRADQVRVHNIGANHVVQELREAGFGIASLQDPFIRRGSIDEEWLVVARPLADLTRRASTPVAAPVAAPVQAAATNSAVDDVALKLSASTRIYIDEFKALHDASNVLVIDVRDKESFRAGRIPGALLIPSEKVADYVEALRAERRLIVAYCSCPAEETSLPAVQTLAKHGITNAKALVGGYRLWVAEKNPIAKGEEPCNGPQCPIKPKPTSDAR
jgi:ubiquinone/menaquinone biosynthesis C-methylase UbiE/rhodanese-related sulfurtransferase